MSRNPVLTEQEAREVLRRQGRAVPPPIADQLARPAGTSREAAKLAALIREHQKKEVWVKIPVTQAMAIAMLERNVRNRKIGRADVEQLKTSLIEQRFYSINNGVGFDWNGFLRDGQHRLIAIAESGVTAELWVMFGMDPAAFDAIDTGRGRKAREFLDLDDIKHGSLVSAVVRLRERVRRNDPTKLGEQAVHRLGKEMAEADDVLARAIIAGNLLRRHKSKMFTKLPASSVTLAYWLIAQDSPRNLKLDAFWDALVGGQQLEAGSPILRLRELLSAFSREPGRAVDQYLAQTRVAAWIILAWNAWSLGEEKLPSFRWTIPHQLPPVR